MTLFSGRQDKAGSEDQLNGEEKGVVSAAGAHVRQDPRFLRGRYVCGIIKVLFHRKTMV